MKVVQHRREKEERGRRKRGKGDERGKEGKDSLVVMEVMTAENRRENEV